ncbi:MAG: BMP family ABC transporter substrate-binding protein [Actinobacteria bacterium]|nr:BMP family ABC transporter substrate-binding protein [Actinomycetota bacterium]
MKRLVKLLGLLLAFTLVAAACGDSDEDSTPADAPDSTEATESTEAAAPASDTNVGLTFDIGGRGDQSFNDSAAAGIDKAESDLGVSYTEAEPNSDGSNRAELLQTQADVSGLVVAVGFLFANDVAAVAAENPDVNFAVIDDAMLDFDNGGVPRGENIAGLTFAEHEGSYLVGVAAALKNESGTLGFIGGVSGFGLIEKFEAGFAAGARSVNADIEIISQYITEFPDFDGFVAPDRAQEIAGAMFAQGADIIYHAAGGSGAGLFEAAADFTGTSGSKVWGIGVDSDQYNTVDSAVQEFVLTSMLKRVDVAVFEITTAHENGTFGPGNTVYNLAVDGVGYSTSGGFIDDIVDQLEAAKADIISGVIEVPTEP